MPDERTAQCVGYALGQHRVQHLTSEGERLTVRPENTGPQGTFQSTGNLRAGKTAHAHHIADSEQRAHDRGLPQQVGDRRTKALD
jgi:hypothetical protein